MNFWKKIKNSIKRLKYKFLLTFGIGIIASAAVVVPTTAYELFQKQNQTEANLNANVVQSNIQTKYNFKEKDDINHLSTVWNNSSPTEKGISADFNSILNYSPEIIYPRSSFIAAAQTSINASNSNNVKHTKEMEKVSHLLKTLDVSQKNQIKNAMLIMHNDAKKYKITAKNAPLFLSQITSKKNIKATEKYLDNSLATINPNKVNEIAPAAPDNYVSSDSFFSSNSTIGSVINGIADAKWAFVGLSLAAFVFSAAMYATAWFFGITLPLANASLLVGVFSGAAAGTLCLINDPIKGAVGENVNIWSTSYNGLLSEAKISRAITKFIGLINGDDVVMDANSWAVVGVTIALTTVGIILSVLLPQ